MSTDTTTDAAVRVQRDSEGGVVTLLLDDPRSSANTMNAGYISAMGAAVEELEDGVADGSITGVVVTSAKRTFFAGGDLVSMIKATPADAEVLFTRIEGVKAQLRALETLGVPVVAAINGSALGGGLEIALATHHRIAVDDGRSEIGLPEVTLGLLPGAGGVTRTVRMLGLQKALMEVLLQGPRMKPARAEETGLVDALVGGLDELIPAARAWIAGQSEPPKQRWDAESYRMPGGTPSSPKLAQFLPAFPSSLRKQLKGAPYEAPRAILSAAVEGAQVDFDTASRIESRYLVSLLTGQTFKNMTQAFFFDLQAINAGRSRPEGFAPREATRLAVLGAGMMGAGIANVSARAGIDVVLKDVTQEGADQGRAHSQKVLDAQVETGRMAPEKRDEILARITATADNADLAGCDFVVEAVFESADLKHRVFGEIEPIVAPDALLGSNTSTLPITGLAHGVQRQEDFVGIHFFSPVEKMPLVELIVGEKTSDEALARAYDYVRQIKKTPIVVNDSRGFFTSRVFGTLVLEGAALLGEGVHAATVEKAAVTKGFPAPPLAMIDEVSLTLPQRINQEAQAAGETELVPFSVHPGMAVVDRMVGEFERVGKTAGAGFYEYPEGGKKFLWPALAEHFGSRPDGSSPVPYVDVQERMTFIMALETARCLEQGVLRSVPDANIGSIMGIGFPPCYGGAIQYVNGYEGGVAGFVARARELAAAYGERFDPPALLVDAAATGEPLR
jgi:3-hydroxyacyl-CoA dehydrogenase/enoyl-CoA hydratase/3-hydroxybutyryl-CoA epimerase